MSSWRKITHAPLHLCHRRPGLAAASATAHAPTSTGMFLVASHQGAHTPPIPPRNCPSHADRELRMAIKERVVVREAAVRRRSDCGGRGSGRRGFASGTLIVRRSGRLARTSAITLRSCRRTGRPFPIRSLVLFIQNARFCAARLLRPLYSHGGCVRRLRRARSWWEDKPNRGSRRSESPGRAECMG